MEPASFALTIVSLYSTCRDCYIYFSDVRNAPKSAIALLRELGIQEAILKSWGAYWKISRHASIIFPSSKNNQKKEADQTRNGKLTEYLARNPFKAQGLADALVLIAEALSNRERLDKEYGIRLETSSREQPGNLALGDVPNTAMTTILAPSGDEVLSRMKAQEKALRSRLGVFKRCKWAFNGREKYHNLIGDLKKYNDSLYMLCPDGAFETMQLNLVVQYLTTHSSAAGLRKLEAPARVAEKAGGFSPSQQGLPLLHDIAELKILKLHSSETLSKREEQSLLTIRQQELQIGKGSVRNLAVCTRKTEGRRRRPEAVYIERKSFRNAEGKPDSTMRESILKLGRLLQSPVCAKRLLCLRCIGLVELESDEIGIVFELPGNLGPSIPRFPAMDLAARKAVPLLLARKLPGLEWRFDLAHKLARSIAFLHASGWLHKNIRSSALLLFPTKDADGIGTAAADLDYDNPILLGYEYSRPDEESGRVKSAPHILRPNDDEEELENELHGATFIEPGDVPDVRTPHFKNHLPASDSDSTDEDIDRLRMRSNRVHQINPTLHHIPAKRANRDLRYTHACDVYSLGILLLEIGLWTRIETLEIPDEDPYSARRAILADHVSYLAFQCGSVYADAVRECISLDPGESEAELEAQADLCARIVAKLAECRV